MNDDPRPTRTLFLGAQREKRVSCDRASSSIDSPESFQGMDLRAIVSYTQFSTSLFVFVARTVLPDSLRRVFLLVLVSALRTPVVCDRHGSSLQRRRLTEITTRSFCLCLSLFLSFLSLSIGPASAG